MQATTAGADQAFWLDHLLVTRKMLWKGAAIDRTWLGDPVSCRNVRLILGMDDSHGRLQVFQRQVELVRIGLLGFASEGCLLERCEQLLKPLDPLILAAICSSFAGYRDVLGRLACCAAISIASRVATSSGRSAASSMAGNYQIPSRFALGNLRSVSHRAAAIRWPPASSSGRHEPRQSRPANRASNWAWVNVINPSLMPGQVMCALPAVCRPLTIPSHPSRSASTGPPCETGTRKPFR